MEANAGALSVVQNTLIEHDRRLIANHDTIARIRDGAQGINAHETKIATMSTELRETREDIADMKTGFEKDREERRKEGADTRRALYTVAAFMATFSATICGLIIALVGHA